MKASVVILSSVVLFSTPVLAHAGQAGLKGSLAEAARQAMNVAPWVSLSVPAVATGEKLEWLAVTSTRQVYSCAAAGTAEAGLAGQVVCSRVAPTRRELAAADRRFSNYNLTQRARIPFPGQAITTYDYVTPAAR